MLEIFIVLLMLAVVAVLLTGVILMGIGGPANAKYGNRLMFMRVSLQGLVLLIIALMFMAGRG